ncbi:MAG: RagB/SusD family nutrient uptake outer membrane protein [Filimonas sp.]|nr:RagB/SusD family nutrient uptake outer membrane protein [Filimonas sp.]
MLSRYFKYTYILLAAVLFTTASCKKFLVEEDPSNLAPETYYTIPEHADAAIAAIYGQIRFIGDGAGIFSTNYQMFDATTGIMTTETAQNSDLNNLYSLVYDGNNLHINQMWNGYYKTVAQANLALDKIPGIPLMDPAIKKQRLGEAAFLRAWAYFYLVRFWGDVPLITKPQTATSSDFYPKRTATEDVYKLIVDDLTAAEAAGFAWVDPSGKVSLAAVKSLLAKVYLTMAGAPLNKGQAYYKLAADKANEVITYANANPAQIGLLPTYNDIHAVANNNKVEHIFEVQYNDAAGAGNPLQSYFLPLHKPVSSIDGVGTSVPTAEFYASYEAGDKRAQNRSGYFYTDYYTNGYLPTLYNPGRPYVFKHFDIIANGTLGTKGTNRSDLNVPQIRYPDVLLTYAEAQNEADGTPNTAAWTAMKVIRDRAGLTTPAQGTYSQTTFREAVWRERWHELCYEGVLWFDMVRTKKVYNEATNGFDSFTGHVNKSTNQPLQDRHLLFPLPVSEMKNNPNLRPQNTGYPGI